MIRISELAETFGVSTETVRRDLDVLSRQGLVDRGYGSALARPMGSQPDFGMRERTGIRERAAIGASASRLVADGEVLMIDSGSTTSHFARALATLDLELTVLTNSFAVATALGAARSIRVILCPGTFSGREAGVYGIETLEFLRRFQANKTFIGAGGLTEAGVMDVNSDACWVKRVMLEQAEASYLLVDHRKFDVRLLERVCPLAALSGIVTDRAPASELGERLADERVPVHLVGLPEPVLSGPSDPDARQP